MTRLLFFIILSLFFIQFVEASSDSKVDKYVREAQYYQKKADNHRKEAAYHIKKAESYQREATYCAKKGKTDTAKGYQRKAEREIDSYKTQLNYAAKTKDKAADYLKRAIRLLQK